jgi:DNA-binding NarL/FixJ family response regulator
MSRIYLVDDHTIMREGLRAMLEAGGHRVVGESAEPVQALEGIRATLPDLVLLDLNLGGSSGFELLAELRRRQLDVCCLVLSMSAQPRHVADALHHGAAGYLLKGSSRADLLRAIDAALQGQRPLDPTVAALAARPDELGSPEERLAQLSPRERQIVELVVRGQSSAAIAERLHLSPKTVDTYRSRLMAKLGVGDVTALVRFAVGVGLVDSEV